MWLDFGTYFVAWLYFHIK